MALKMMIPGKQSDKSTKTAGAVKLGDSDLSLSIEVQEVVDVASARDAGGAVPVDLIPPPPEGAASEGQVFEVELDGGITLWLRPESLYRDFGKPGARGAAADKEVLEIAPAFSSRVATRGEAKEQTIRRLTVYQWRSSRAPLPEPPAAPPSEAGTRGVGTDAAVGWVKDQLTEKGGELLARPVARTAEEHLLGNKPGLYRVELSRDLTMTLADGIAATDGPILLFLHGTMSSFKGSFSKLGDPKNSAGAKILEQLARRYKNAYAWEHRTLTESPVENALNLAKMLPAGARLHLVSHSRGGLVGDLLCLGTRETGTGELSPDTIVEIFTKAAGQETEDGQEARKTQAEKLRELIKVLSEVKEGKKISVDRFVRVACPARGTTLASGKLDRWLSVVKLLGDMALPVAFPLNLLIALIGTHDDPAKLPGLEAMMPGSPLVHLLNYPALKVSADLSVISGDTEGKGFLGRLKELMLDQFFEDECDVVVNTGAMYGGLKRVDGGRFHLDTGPEVNHFSYFTNEETVRMLGAGLLRGDGTDAGFLPVSTAPEKEPARAVLRRAPREPLPVVFVLPGIMGSTLLVDDKKIWLNLLALMTGQFDKLDIDRTVTPDAPFDEYYGELMERLGDSHEVVPFPYDWRRSIMEAGESLAGRIAAKLEEIDRRGTNQPVRILAHSLGGLVARAMIAGKPDVWRRMTANRDSRLLMLGTPNGGSYEIVRLLTGGANTLQRLALVDFAHDRKDLLEIIARFPGVLELLPVDDQYKFFGEDVWQQMREQDDEMRGKRFPLPKFDDLQRARRTWETILATQLDPDRTLYVAGQAKQTPILWRPGTEHDWLHPGDEHKCIVFEATARGDGKVPWDTGIPANVKTWYLPDVEHGDLPAHEEAFPAYVELLQSGTTTRLSTTQPAGVRSAMLEERTVLSREVPPFLPDEKDLAAGFLGTGVGRRKKKPKIRLPKVTVSITHGDLACALHPICVGHYAGDTIVSAEDYLDHVLGGRLRERIRVGLYPGRVGTCEVVFNPDRYGNPLGAIVIGLGRVGELSPGNLESGFTQAALQYAVHVAECEDGRFDTLPGVPRSARITSLLIGTGAGGITIRDSMEAILRGTAAANRLLYEQGLSGKVLIDAVEFIELWQDMAIRAAQDLGLALMDGMLADFFVWPERTVKCGEGGRRRVQFEEGSDWWHRLEIAHDKKKDELRFIALTDRARAEETLVAGQLRLADDMIRRTIADTRRDSGITRALFEMLIPNRLKELAPNQYDVVLVVDEVSGGYPWELLENRWSGDDRPQSVASGVLRQFKTEVFREKPVTTLEDTVYVVGNPLISGEASKIFPSLEGARREAEDVADFLQQNGFLVNRKIGLDAQQILAGLHERGYKVLHLAGHGVHEWPLDGPPAGICELCKQNLPPNTKKVSGMVIGEGVFLTPGDVEQMRWVPELVFINCCHLGNLTPDGATNQYRLFHRLAANLGAQFIRMGVRAVVTAGWAVDDAAARTFATGLYKRMLEGDKFGEAVRSAREETFDRHGTTNTWGAYQCYGDPVYRLRARKPQERQGTGFETPEYVSHAQAVMELENLAKRVRTMSGSPDEVEAILRGIAKRDDDRKAEKDDRWLDRPDVAAAVGLAYGEFGMFDKALPHLDRALKGEKAGVEVRVVEQLADFKSRRAVELKQGAAAGEDKRSPDQLIRESFDELQALESFGETARRLSLLGSASRRKAWVTSGEERKDALTAMAAYYKKAHDKNYNEERGTMDVCALMNWLTAELLCGPYGVERAEPVDIEDWCEKARARGEERNRQEPNFSNAVTRAVCDLVQAMASGKLKERRDSIVQAYRQAMSRGPSPLEFLAVMEPVQFLAEMVKDAVELPADPEATKATGEEAESLRQIAEQLAPLAPRWWT